MEPKKKKKIIDLTVIDEFLESGVSAIALVEEPAIEVDFFAFKKEKFVEPRAGEKEGDFIGRCIGVLVGDEGYEQDQAAAICYSTWRETHEIQKFESYDDYPEAAKNNAQRALDWAAENGWGSCGTPVGKVRANQLAKGEPISEDTISRMASFARHKQNSDTPYGEGCGKLMWDAWGGDAGIEWASRKLEEIKKEKMAIEPNPCWEGYEPIGFKPGRGGKQVPNCVPVEALALMYEYKTDLPLFETPEAAIDYALNVYGCNGYHEHIIGDAIYYMPCETHPEDMDIVVNAPPYIEQVGPTRKKKQVTEDLLTPVLKYSYATDKNAQETILAFARQFGQSYDEVHMEFANAYAYAGGSTNPQSLTPTDGTVKNLYKYTGDIGLNSRDFCVQMIGLDKYYTFEEVQAMSNIALNAGFGEGGSDTYDIWLFKGGPNCKHHWTKYFASIQEGEFRLNYGGKVSGRPGTNPYNMPKRGYVNPPGQFAAFETADQRILVGPFMIPNMEIPRKDKNGIYYVQFSEEAVAMIAEKFMREQSTWNTNQDHDNAKPAETYVFESWIIEDPETDKAKTVYGYDLPKGTWMGKMRVYSDETWARVKSGELKGFSVEGDFISEEELAQLKEEMEMLEMIKQIVS